MDTAELTVKFQEVFGAQPDATFFSPGRINLIGEHTDYNGGHVFPAAITLGTYGAARKRDDNKLRFYSANFEEVGIIETRLDELVYKKEDNWTNYAKGVLKFLGEEGHAITSGMDVFVYGNIPNGSGLSSSASLELLIGIIAQELFDLKLERIDLVKIGKRTENGAPGGTTGGGKGGDRNSRGSAATGRGGGGGGGSTGNAGGAGGDGIVIIRLHTA